MSEQEKKWQFAKWQIQAKFSLSAIYKAKKIFFIENELFKEKGE